MTMIQAPPSKSMDFLTEVALDKVPGCKIWNAMGERENGGASGAIRISGEDVWRGNDSGVGGDVFIPTPPIQGEQMEVISSSNQDQPSGILTFTGNALDTETCIVGTKTYTFQTTLTDVDGNVLIGATTADTISNFVDALLPDALSGKGTNFAASMTAQPEGIKATAAGLVIAFQIDTGTPTSTDTLSNASWGAGTMTARTGVGIVEIEYLDSSGAEQEEVIVMNGTTAVLTAYTDAMFVNDFYSLLSATTATGNITVRTAGGSGIDTYNIIAIRGNKSLVCNRMVPKGKSLILHGWKGTEVGNKRNIYRIRSTDMHGIRRPGIFCFKDNVYLKLDSSGELKLNNLVPELSVVKISMWADQSSAEGSCSWWGILCDN